MAARRMKSHQRGAAIITALLVVMLAATIATYLLMQQSHALTRTARTTDRAQAALYTQPTLDWARAILFETLKNATYVHPKQAWAQGINALPLDDAGGGTLASGVIRDEGGKFNINNMVSNGVKSPADIEVFQRLLTVLKIDADLAPAVVDWLDKDSDLTPNGAEDSFYLSLPEPYRSANQPMLQVAELTRVRGFDAATVKRLAPYVTALPARTMLNMNSALPEVIRAYFPDMTETGAIALVRSRDDLPFKDIDAVKNQKEMKGIPEVSVIKFASVTSTFFSVSIAITRDATQVRQNALLKTADPVGSRWPSIIWVNSF
jgi:general secretion pathway protein K